MSNVTASLSCLGLITIVVACAEDDGLGMAPGQGVMGPGQTSSQTTQSATSPEVVSENTSSGGTSTPPNPVTPMPTLPSQPTPEPEVEPTPLAPEPTDGAGLGNNGVGLGGGSDGPGQMGEGGGTGVGDASGGAGGAEEPAPMSAGGMPGDDMGTGGGGGDDPMTEGAMPSAACGSGGGMPNLNLQNTIVTIPDSYDGTTPVPVVIAFHAAGNGNDQMQGIIGSTFQSEYIMLYPKSGGNEWNNQADSSKVDAIFDALDASACYDQNRVFAAGHSSGAQFIVQRLCAGESRWRAVSPVASSVYCESWDPIPALVIHGIGDVEREAYGLNDGDGEKDIVPYRTSNGCMESFTPVEVEGCMSGGVNVDPGCRDFDGCSELTRWCQHTDPQYGTSHHGVPCFGARVMKEFFDMFR